MASPYFLTAVKAGITRLRTKAGAARESLYDLLNGYVDASRKMKSRPGTSLTHNLPVGTIGLTVFDGKRHVYADTFIPMTDPNYVCNVLPYPGTIEVQPPPPGFPEPDPISLSKIWFAEPLMGFLFVVAEYSTGEIFYFWPIGGGAASVGANPWQANTVYFINSQVRPTDENGLYYSANRRNPPAPLWKKDAPRQIGDRVSPTTYNGYEFVVIDVQGTNPKSGATEPTWILPEGAITYEDLDLNPIVDDGGDDDSGGGGDTPRDIDDRYNRSSTGGGTTTEAV